MTTRITSESITAMMLDFLARDLAARKESCEAFTQRIRDEVTAHRAPSGVKKSASA